MPDTQTPPTLQQLAALAVALDQALQKQDARITNLIKWLKDQFRDINAALDKLDAPPSTDEAPALTEIRDRLARIENYLAQEDGFSLPPPR